MINTTMCSGGWTNACLVLIGCDETYRPIAQGTTVYWMGNNVVNMACKIWYRLVSLNWYAQLMLNNGDISIGPFVLPCMLSTFQWSSANSSCTTTLLYAQHS